MHIKPLIFGFLGVVFLTTPARADFPDFPSEEGSSYVEAVERAAHARATYELMQDQFHAAIRDLQRKFETSDEYKEALAKEKEANDRLNAARAKAVSPLRNDAKYQATLKLRDEVAADIEVYRLQKMSPESMVPLATLKLDYNRSLRRMEEQYLKNNDDIGKAKRELMETSRKVGELKAEFAEIVRKDKKVLAAKEEMEYARIEVVAASARLRAAKIVADAAVDHANREDRWDDDDTFNWWPRHRPRRWWEE